MVITSAYGPVRPYNSWGRVKKLSRVGKGIPDMYIEFRFGAKITIFRATNGVA